MRAFPAILQAHGFQFVTTGGNCTAYERNDGQISELITVDGKCEAPTALTDDCIIGTGEVDGPEPAYERATLAEIIRVLEHPSDEYYLLSLRLVNLR